MKNILSIYKKDLKDIFNNKALLIVIIGLSILPSLYAWFNIKASWDPYSNTQNISVAVVNQDSGTNVLDKDINIGDELIEKLKKNDNLGWKFVNKQDALKGINKGEYYAVIEIPSDFSKDITSLISDEAKKANINYIVNEKINAIAPKITDKGASTIQNQVNQSVVKMVSEIVFEVSNEAGIELETNIPKLSGLQNELIDVQNKFKYIDKTISSAEEANYKIGEVISELNKDMPLIEDTIINSIDLSHDVDKFLKDSQEGLKDISPTIKNDLKLLNEVAKNVTDDISDLIDIINKGSENAPESINNLYNKVSNLKNSTNSILEFLKRLDKITSSNALKKPIEDLTNIVDKLTLTLNALDDIKYKVNNGETPSTANLEKVLNISKDIENISYSILNNFDNQIKIPINSLFEDSYKVTEGVSQILEEAKNKLPLVKDVLTSSKQFSNNADEDIEFIKEKLPLAKGVVDDLVEKIKEVNENEDLDELVSFLKNDVINKSEFLEEPVEIVTNKLYSIPNYGSAMTPFYTVLSLWVGVLLLTSVLSVDVREDFKPNEVYFGRGLTFLSVSIVQSLIVSIGNFIVLGTSATNPVLFVILSVFISMVFTSIVYSLVSVFSNVGKAIGIILLVIQVSASGGTFPVEVTPQFFRFVNPYLPFTYAISSLRESVGGVFMTNLINDVLILFVFMIISIILTVLFKERINKSSEGFKQKLNDSDLIGH